MSKEIIKNQATKEIEKIIDCSIKITKNIQKYYNLPYNLVVFENIIFLLFLNDLKLTIRNMPEKYKDLILSGLFGALEKTKALDYQKYKDNILNVIDLRFQTYAKIYEQYDVFETGFLENVFKYQADLFFVIGKEKILSNYNPFQDSSDYQLKTKCTNTSLINLISTKLVDNVELILDFYKD